MGVSLESKKEKMPVEAKYYRMHQLEASKARKRKPDVAAPTVRRHRCSLGVVCLIGFCTCILMYIVFANARVSELAVSLQDLQNNITELEQQEGKLQTAVDMRIASCDIEKYAKEIGMVRENEAECACIQGDSEDLIVVYDREDEVPTGLIAVVMNALIDDFRDFAKFMEKEEQ